MEWLHYAARVKHNIHCDPETTTNYYMTIKFASTQLHIEIQIYNPNVFSINATFY